MSIVDEQGSLRCSWPVERSFHSFGQQKALNSAGIGRGVCLLFIFIFIFILLRLLPWLALSSLCALPKAFASSRVIRASLRLRGNGLAW
jgi:hypothetical protein